MRPARFKWIAATLLVLTLLGAGGWFVIHTPLFHVRTITVIGNRHLSDAEVTRLAGLSGTTNVLWLRTGAVARRLERDPWIRRARVSRSLPGTVAVTIEERHPVAVVETGRMLLLVSGDGRVLGRARPMARLPRITLLGVPVSPGSRIPGSPGELVVARSLPPGVRGEVARITQPARGPLTVILRDGIQVLFGDASEADAKGRALFGVLSWARNQGIRVGSIDVRAPAAPALLPVGSGPSP